MPTHLVESVNRADFFVRFNSAESVASIKLLDAEKTPTKFYKVSVSGRGRVAVFEDVRVNAFLAGRQRNEERLRNAVIVNLGDRPKPLYYGFWIT